MRRWVIAFLGAWGICVAGMYVAWIVGLTLNCMFATGCLQWLSIGHLISAVNLKSVVTKGTILAVVLIVMAWVGGRKR